MKITLIKTMLVLLILVALVLLLLICWILIRMARFNKLTENIPTGGNFYPLIGHVLFYKIKNSRDLYLISESMTRGFEEKKILKMWFGPILGICTWDADHIEALANSPYATLKGKLYNMGMGDAFHGVVTADTGQKWKELRKPLVKSFSKKFMNAYHTVFVKKCNIFAEYLEEQKEGQEIDVLKTVSNVLLDMFAESHLGVPTNEVIEEKYNWVEHFHTYFDSTVVNISTCHFYFRKIGLYVIKAGKEIRKSRAAMNKFHQWVLDERAKNRFQKQAECELYSDFLLRRSLEKKIPRSQIYKELADTVLAASDTSSIISSSALLFLAMFPEVQEEAYQEQINVLGDSDKDPTPNDLENMVYLKMVIKETMRLVGVPGIFRNASEDIKIGEYVLPKGTILYINLKALHSDPLYWEKPKEFYPNHFLPDKEANRHRFAFLPFGIAPRMCAGFQYGTNSILMLLSKVLRKFEVSTSLKYDELEFVYKLLLCPNQGYKVKFHRRNKS